MKIIQWLIVFALFAALPAGAQDADLWSLEKCIDHALMNNLRVKSSELRVEDNTLVLKQSKFDILPNLNLGASNSYRWGRSIDPTTNQFIRQRIGTNGLTGSSSMTLFTGLRKYNTIKQNEVNTEASLYDLEKAKNDAMLYVVRGYLQILFTQEQFDNANRQLETTRTQLERTTKLVEAGSLPVTNKLDLQAQLASNEVELIRAENEIELAKLQLKQYLQIPAETPFEIIVPEFNEANLMMIDMTTSEIFSKAEALQPEVISADLGVKSADYSIKLAKAALYPTLSVNADLYTNYSDAALSREFTGDSIPVPSVDIGRLKSNPLEIVESKPGGLPVTNNFVTPIGTQYSDNVSNSVGFSLRIPIFNGYSARTSTQRATIQKVQREIEAKQVRNDLRQIVETSHNDARAAAKTYEASLKQVSALEESFRATERSYNLGALNFVDYQVSSNNLFRAKSDLVRSKYDYIFKLKILDFYLGNPINL